MASDFSIRHAAHIVKNGGIIAYPTDTIYGLGCDPYNADAVERLNVIKRRSSNKQFILLAGHINQVKDLLLFDKSEQKKITANAEPTSWVVNATPTTPEWLTRSSNKGDNDNHTLTIRISKNDTVRKLCDALGHAIISTSANLSGKRPAENTFYLHKLFHSTVDKILATNKPLTSKPSKVIRLCDNHVFRP
jgi:L-threonylcarbamoyladenylate synthase